MPHGHYISRTRGPKGFRYKYAKKHETKKGVDVEHLLEGNFGIKRVDMPQIRSDLVGEFVDEMKASGVDVTRPMRAAATLKATQSELHADKVRGLAAPENLEHLRKPVIVSNDGFLLDGHHRWAALVTLDPQAKIQTVRIDLGIHDLLDRAVHFDKVAFKKSQKDQPMDDLFKASYDLEFDALLKGDLDECLDWLLKGAGHKYLRRVPTGKAKPKYRYIYSVNSKAHGSDPKVGEKVKISHKGKDGHYEVTHTHDDGHVTVKHDETGHEMKVHKDHMHDQFKGQHGDAINKKTKDLMRVHEAAQKHGTDKQKARAKQALVDHAERYDVSRAGTKLADKIKAEGGEKSIQDMNLKELGDEREKILKRRESMKRLASLVAVYGGDHPYVDSEVAVFGALGGDVAQMKAGVQAHAAKLDSEVAVKNRATVENKIAKKFSPDDKSGRGANRQLRLYGNAARVLDATSGTVVKLRDLGNREIRKLAGLLRVSFEDASGPSGASKGGLDEIKRQEASSKKRREAQAAKRASEKAADAGLKAMGGKQLKDRPSGTAPEDRPGGVAAHRVDPKSTPSANREKMQAAKTRDQEASGIKKMSARFAEDISIGYQNTALKRASSVHSSISRLDGLARKQGKALRELSDESLARAHAYAGELEKHRTRRGLMGYDSTAAKLEMEITRREASAKPKAKDKGEASADKQAKAEGKPTGNPEAARQISQLMRGWGRDPISSGDSQAVPKLQARIKDTEAALDHVKTANRAVRLKDKAKGDAKLKALGFSEQSIAKLREPDYAGRVGFPGYILQNGRANVKRMKERVSSVAAEQATPEAPERKVGKGASVVEDKEANRIRIHTNGKPSEEVRASLKRNGFKYSPRNQAWQRQLNANGRDAVSRMVREHFPEDAEEPKGSREKMQEAKARDQGDASKGVVHQVDGKGPHLVDSKAVQAMVSKLRGEHEGGGNFAVQTPHGEVSLYRTTKPEGMGGTGRAHRVSGSPQAVNHALTAVGLGGPTRSEGLLKEAEKTLKETAASPAKSGKGEGVHFKSEGGSHIGGNALQSMISKLGGEHVGFGDFKVKTPHGEVHATRRSPPEGMPKVSGRVHSLSGDPKAIAHALKEIGHDPGTGDTVGQQSLFRSRRGERMDLIKAKYLTRKKGPHGWMYTYPAGSKAKSDHAADAKKHEAAHEGAKKDSEVFDSDHAKMAAASYHAAGDHARAARLTAEHDVAKKTGLDRDHEIRRHIEGNGGQHTDFTSTQGEKPASAVRNHAGGTDKLGATSGGQHVYTSGKGSEHYSKKDHADAARLHEKEATHRRHGMVMEEEAVDGTPAGDRYDAHEAAVKHHKGLAAKHQKLAKGEKTMDPKDRRALLKSFAPQGGMSSLFLDSKIQDEVLEKSDASMTKCPKCGKKSCKGCGTAEGMGGPEGGNGKTEHLNPRSVQGALTKSFDDLGSEPEGGGWYAGRPKLVPRVTPEYSFAAEDAIRPAAPSSTLNKSGAEAYARGAVDEALKRCYRAHVMVNESANPAANAVLSKALGNERPSIVRGMEGMLKTNDPSLAAVVRDAAQLLKSWAADDANIAAGLEAMGASEVTIAERLPALGLTPERTLRGR